MPRFKTSPYFKNLDWSNVNKVELPWCGLALELNKFESLPYTYEEAIDYVD